MLKIRDCVRDVVLIYLIPTSVFDVVFYEMSAEMRLSFIAGFFCLIFYKQQHLSLHSSEDYGFGYISDFCFR